VLVSFRLRDQRMGYYSQGQKAKDIVNSIIFAQYDICTGPFNARLNKSGSDDDREAT
jgi:hypothetical protein